MARAVAAEPYDRLLRRSFHAAGQSALAQIAGRSRCPWLIAGNRSFPPVLARTWHAVWMQTTGACQVRTSSAGSQRCLRSCMRAVVRPCCCTSCCMDLTPTRQGNLVRLQLATRLYWRWPLRPEAKYRRGLPAPRSMPGLRMAVCQCLLASVAGRGDCHSIGHLAGRACADSLLACHDGSTLSLSLPGSAAS